MPHGLQSNVYTLKFNINEQDVPASIVLQINPLTIGTWMKCFRTNYANYVGANKIENAYLLYCLPLETKNPNFKLIINR